MLDNCVTTKPRNHITYCSKYIYHNLISMIAPGRQPFLHHYSYLVALQEPPNKGHFGDGVNSIVLSIVERLSSFWKIETVNFGT